MARRDQAARTPPEPGVSGGGGGAGAGAGAGRGGQQFKMLVLPSPDRPLLPGPRPEKKLEKVVGGSGENTLK